MDFKERDDELFPPGLVDEHNEPLDIRSSTTWNQQIQEVSAIELMEVQIVNSTVPFLLISAFTPLLKVRYYPFCETNANNSLGSCCNISS